MSGIDLFKTIPGDSFLISIIYETKSVGNHPVHITLITSLPNQYTKNVYTV